MTMRIAAAFLSMLIAAQAGAKAITYPIEPDILATPPDQLGMTPAPAPARGDHDIVLTLGTGVDHDAQFAGVMSRTKPMPNPLSTLVRTVLTERDADSRLDDRTAGVPALAITVDRGATLSRCVIVGELLGTCIVRVSIDGAAGPAGAVPRPIHLVVDRDIKGVMISHCIALISREAVIQFLAEAERQGAAP